MTCSRSWLAGWRALPADDDPWSMTMREIDRSASRSRANRWIMHCGCTWPALGGAACLSSLCICAAAYYSHMIDEQFPETRPPAVHSTSTPYSCKGSCLSNLTCSFQVFFGSPNRAAATTGYEKKKNWSCFGTCFFTWHLLIIFYLYLFYFFVFWLGYSI